MEKIWIGLSSKAGAGKSTIAKALVEDYGFERVSFARRLKEICEELFPDMMRDKSKNEYRWILQKFGTEYCRSIKDSVWVDIVLFQLEQYNIAGIDSKIIVDDVRFLNEFHALKQRGFKMVRIRMDDAQRAKWGYNTKDQHPSEVELDKIGFDAWDLYIFNKYKYPFKGAVQLIVEKFGVKK